MCFVLIFLFFMASLIRYIALYVDVVCSSWIDRLQSLPFIVAACTAPLVGIAVDYGGHRTSLIAVAPFILVCAHAIMACGLWNPHVPLFLIGIAYRFVHACVYIILSIYIS